MRLVVRRGRAKFLKGGYIPRKSVLRGAILRRDGFPGTPGAEKGCFARSNSCLAIFKMLQNVAREMLEIAFQRV